MHQHQENILGDGFLSLFLYHLSSYKKIKKQLTIYNINISLKHAMSNLIYTNKKIYLEFELACLWIDISHINVLPPSQKSQI